MLGFYLFRLQQQFSDREDVYLSLANQVASGDHWVFESEIFWKARGDYLRIAEACFACVFKKISEANARW
jgi:hypothetical protein